jgi:hypothetical protein
MMKKSFENKQVVVENPSTMRKSLSKGSLKLENNITANKCTKPKTNVNSVKKPLMSARTNIYSTFQNNYRTTPFS